MNAPDDTVLDHAHRLFFGELGLCGCGTPPAACALVRDILALIGDGEWARSPLAQELKGNPGAYHLILSALDEAGLIEHGSSFEVAWLTDKGRWYGSALSMIKAWRAVADDGGDPHGGADCTDACWQVSIGP